jgi:hypothetical protein
VLRSKGFFWLATRHDWAGSWSQAGPACRTEGAGLWWAAAPKNQWPDAEAEVRDIMADWRKPWGDRRQELVIIGQSLDRPRLTDLLDACLLTDAEMQLGPTGWLATFKDPFVEWHAPTPDEDPAQPTDTLLRD